jgi:hypothetical protein
MNLLERSYGLCVISMTSFRAYIEPVGVSIFIDWFSGGEFLMQRMTNWVIFDVEKAANLVSVNL